MSPVIGDSKSKQSKDEALRAMYKALDIERRSRYADFHGRRSTFSQFMRQTCARLSKEFPLEGTWMTLRGLFRQYPNTDVGTRISIVSRAEELLIPYVESLHNARLERLKTHPEEEPDAGAIEAVLGDAEGALPEGEAVAAGGAARARPATRAVDPDQMFRRQPEVAETSSASGAPSLKFAQSDVRTVSARSGPGGKTSQKRDLPQASTPGTSLTRLEKPSSDAVKGGAPGADKLPDFIDVQFVKGVGPKMATVLNRIDIFTVGDLLRHYPRRHLDFQNRLHIKDLEEDQEVSIFGTIRSVSAFQSKKRNISVLTVTIGDGTGVVGITRFVGGRSNKYLLDRYKAQFPKGAQVLASGIVERDKFSRKFQLKNAEVEVLGLLTETEDPQPASLHAGRLVPVYPLTEGLSLRHLRTVIHNALDKYGDGIVDPLPEIIREKLGLMGLREALYTIHFPEAVESKDEARRRLVFDELFAIQLQLAHRRHRFDQTEGALALAHSDEGLVVDLRKSLPFELTGAQKRVFGEIARDLASTKPMHRLVQGDVGSGKTVVALMAFMVAIENNYQGAMMAPTEILA
ncbi:MAG: hypothetical protein KC777_09930, partial [Cyanobacteria bacterium HKST-UBA02]|nr:hypothetical protein [Cyanobacteria bacterium HKST-UBA02]